MATRRRRTAATFAPSPLDLIPPSAPPATEEPGPSDETKDTIERMTISVRPDGSIAADRMHRTTLDKLKLIASDTRNRAVFGEPSTSAPSRVDEDDEPLPSFVVQMGISGLQMLELITVSVITKAPGEIVQRVTTFDEAQRKKLYDPMEAVINKYSGDWLKYKEEMALAVALVEITMGNIARVKVAMVTPAVTVTT